MTQESPQIVIHKLNQSYIRINSSLDIGLELSEFFTFFVDGYKFTPKYKAGIWDGKIRLFNISSRTIYAGLLSKVIEFCKSRKYSYEVDEGTQEYPDVSYEESVKYVDSLNLHTKGVKLDIREYQYRAVHAGLSKRRLILKSSVGSGKSMMLYCISRYITEVLGGRVLIIVPTISLTNQLKADFEDYSSHNSYPVNEEVHLISQGKSKESECPIVISTFQSLLKQPPAFFNGDGKGVGATSSNNGFKAIITDEGHMIQAKTFQDIYGVATNVPFRIACTGTLQELKCNIMTMEGLTGPVEYIVETKELIENKQLVPLNVKSISLRYDEETSKIISKMSYDDEIKWLTTNQKRNKFICNLAKNCTGATLILFRFVSHGNALYDLLTEMCGDTRKVNLINGGVVGDDREEIRLSIDGSDSITIASYGTFKLGVNAPSLQNIIIGHPVKSSITFLQSIGRGLRLRKNKKDCNLFDIGDNLSYTTPKKTYTNTTYNHFNDRLKILLNEGYEYKIINVPF